MRLDFGWLEYASQETLVTAQQELWPMLAEHLSLRPVIGSTESWITGSGRITSMNWRRDHFRDWGSLTFHTFTQWQVLGHSGQSDVCQRQSAMYR